MIKIDVKSVAMDTSPLAEIVTVSWR